MADSSPIIVAEEVATPENARLPPEDECTLLDAGEALLTMPSQIGDEESQNITGLRSEISPDLFQGASVVEVDSQPKTKKNQESSATSIAAKEISVRSNHPMATRSKSGVLNDGICVGSTHSSRRASFRSFRSRSTMRSGFSTLSDSQLNNFYETKKMNQRRKVTLEAEQMKKRLAEEEASLQEAYGREEAELQEQMLKIQKEMQQKHEEMLKKRQFEKESMKEHVKKNLQELQRRSQREQMELYIEHSEALAERGLSPMIDLTQNHLQSIMPPNILPEVSEASNAVSLAETTVPTSVRISMAVTHAAASMTTVQAVQPLAVVSQASISDRGMLGGSFAPDFEICVPQSNPMSNSVSGSVNANVACSMPALNIHPDTPAVSVMNRFEAPDGAVSLASLAVDREIPLQNLNPGLSRIRGYQSQPCVNVACTPAVTAPIPTIQTNQASIFPINSVQTSQINPNQMNSDPGQTSVPQIICVTPPVGLPPSVPPIFDGNPSEFKNFIDIFQSVICSKVQSPKEQFIYLQQYTKGPANALVKGCQHRGPLCFKEAVQILEEHYGQKLQVGHACLNSVSFGPQLKLTDRDSLTVFYADLTSCINALEDIEYRGVPLIIIDKIANRMPPVWRSGWLSLIDDILNERKEELTLRHLAGYVR